MDPNVVTHGSLKDFADPVTLYAGQLRMVFDRGFIGFVKIGDLHLVREINYLVRDQNWGTLPMKILSQSIEHNKVEFKINYEAQSTENDIDIFWNCKIVGTRNSTIRFEVRGQALSNFEGNRVGLTLLHPSSSCSGKSCKITHPNGTSEIKLFPKEVVPHQPFFDISGMSWSPDNGIDVHVNFEGDVFESEDQRNWTDLSYKTYCPPLSQPYPKKFVKGDTLKHAVTIKVEAKSYEITRRAKPIKISVDETKIHDFPKIGLSLNNLKHDQRETDLVKKLNLDFLQVALDGNHSEENKINRVFKIANEIGIRLKVVFSISGEVDEQLLAHLKPYEKSIDSIVILDKEKPATTQNLILDNLQLIKKYFPNKPIGGGTNGFFADLNRNRTPPDQLDFLTFSLNPQVHSFDNPSITETILGQRDVANTCQKIAKGKKVHIGSVTFKIRAPQDDVDAQNLTSQNLINNIAADPRQLSLYGAGWLLGSIKYLAESKVAAITYFETTGLLGLFSQPSQLWPDTFKMPEDSVYPMYLLLKQLMKLKVYKMSTLESSFPLILNGMSWVDNDGKKTIILANFTHKPQPFVVVKPRYENATFKIIDASNINELVMSPNFYNELPLQKMEGIIDITPYGILVISE